jgi:hypothetical protein
MLLVNEVEVSPSEHGLKRRMFLSPGFRWI